MFVTDSVKIPNNWVLRKSTILKRLGHETSMSFREPDEIHVSCVFRKNANQFSGLPLLYPDTDIHFGGTGFNNNLDHEIDGVMPDYSLSKFDYSIGHTTRGCPNNCYFCIVPKKEGHRTYRVQHIEEFHNPEYNTVMLLDSNILQDKDWFFENTDYLIENDLTLLEHGMDARMVDDEIAQRIKEIKFHGAPKFAFDDMKDRDEIVRGMKILKRNGVKGSFYVYCHDERAITDAINRKELIQKHGHDWHIMTNIDAPQTKRFKRFKRWGARPAISRSHKFEYA